MKLLAKAIATYFALGFLTMLHWHFVWLKAVPYDRVEVEILFGPLIWLAWPQYWIAMIHLGSVAL